jgi:hypothetical protein
MAPRSKRATPPADDTDDGAYRLLSIGKTNAPDGSDGRDWVLYRIAQGANIITGYRRGSLTAATEDVGKVVDGLNERRLVRRGRVDLTARPSAAAVTPPASTESS